MPTIEAPEEKIAPSSGAIKVVPQVGQPAPRAIKPVTIPIEEVPSEEAITKEVITEEVKEIEEVKKPEVNVTEDFLKPTQVFDFDETSGELKASKEADSKKSKK